MQLAYYDGKAEAHCRWYTLAMASMTALRFPIRFENWYRALSSALLLRPSDSYVDVGNDDVSVKMGWAFRARFPRSAVAGTVPLRKSVLSRGVHGFAGRWLVNGSGDRIVALDLQPAQRAYVMGFPVRLQQLMVSVEDPEAFATRLQSM